MTWRPIMASLPEWVGQTELVLCANELEHIVNVAAGVSAAVLWFVRRGNVLHHRFVPIDQLEVELAEYVRAEDAKLTAAEREIRKWIFATDEDSPDAADIVVTFAMKRFSIRIPVVNGRIVWPKPS
jgi:hypothetical protein